MSPTATGSDTLGIDHSLDDRQRAISAATPSAEPMQDAADAELERAAEQQAAERNAELNSLAKAAEARPARSPRTSGSCRPAATT